MNIQQIQEVLNYLILIITASFTTVMLVDFGWRLVHLWHEVSAQIELDSNTNISEQSNIEFRETTNCNLHLAKENYHSPANYNFVVHSSANIEHNNGNQSGVLDDDLTKVEEQNQSTISTNLEHNNSNHSGVSNDELIKIEKQENSTTFTKLEHDNSNQSNDNTPLQSELEINNSITVDIDKIDLRTARKIASAIKKSTNPKSDLIIKQKVNGKNVPLAWLQAQIKNRLEIAPEIVQPIIQELAPNAIHDSDKNIQYHHILQKGKPQRQVC